MSEIKKMNIKISNVKEIAKRESIVYGACFADVSENIANNREQGFYDGFIRCATILSNTKI